MRDAPHAAAGQRIGLLGGSFDPAHDGHAHVAETALRRLGLHAVWWLVSPQNPLKSGSSPLPLRVASARRMARGSRMRVTDLEARMGLAYTIDTLKALRRLHPQTHFVWLMGADNLEGFERWRDWQRIVRLVPICVVSRPGAGPKARLGRFARQFQDARVRSEAAGALPLARPPAWTCLNARWNRQSSTALRAAGQGLMP